MAKSKRKKNDPQTGKHKLHFERIIPLKELFPKKLLKDKLHAIQKNPFIKKMESKVKSGIKIMGEQASIIGKTARGFALQTQTHVKIASYNSQINKLYMSIGEEVYEQTKNEKKLAPQESNIPKYIKSIGEMEQEISLLEKKLTDGVV